MVTRALTWRAAVDLACEQLLEFAAQRDTGHSVAETAVAMGIGLQTAVRYERTLTLLLAVLNEKAAPVAAEAASERNTQ